MHLEECGTASSYLLRSSLQSIPARTRTCGGRRRGCWSHIVGFARNRDIEFESFLALTFADFLMLVHIKSSLLRAQPPPTSPHRCEVNFGPADPLRVSILLLFWCPEHGSIQRARNTTQVAQELFARLSAHQPNLVDQCEVSGMEPILRSRQDA